MFTQLTDGQKRNHLIKGLGIVTLNYELGWLSGLILSEGTAVPSAIALPQSKTSPILNRLITTL